MSNAMATLALLVVFVSPSLSQETGGDSTSFDFWVGRWSLRWTDPDSTRATGENVVRKVLGGAVLQENLRALSGANAGFDGMSVSVFSGADRRWRQTWVDNQKGYLEFTGGAMGDKRFFARTGTGPDGKTIHQRMVFYNITPDVFDWDWERSSDGGKSWTLEWRIHYERKKD